MVGIGACFSGREMLDFTIRSAWQILKCYGLLSGLGVMVRGLRVEQVVQPPKGDLHYIAHLGVAEMWRSQGIGSQLVAYLLAQGRAVGRETAALDVAVTNPRAQALYKRLGFVVMGERESNLSNKFGVVVNHKRMERPYWPQLYLGRVIVDVVRSA